MTQNLSKTEQQTAALGLFAAPATFSVNVYSKDLVVARGTSGMSGLFPPSLKVPPWAERQRPKRGNIEGFSWKSKKRALLTFRNAQEGRYAKHKRPLRNSIDLTYPAEYPRDGRIIKKHLHEFLLWLNGLGGLFEWVLEFQVERGKAGKGYAPHFHLLTNIYVPKSAVSRRWYEIVGSGDGRHLAAGTRVEGIRDVSKVSTYLVHKYVLKAEQKDVPEDFINVGRFWGYSSALLEIEQLFTRHYAVNASDEMARIQKKERNEYLRSLRRWYRAHCRGWPPYMRPRRIGARLNRLGKVFRNGRQFHDAYMARVNPRHLFSPLSAVEV